MSVADSEQYNLLDQLAEEFAARFRRGEQPSLEEYTDRYPELADDIRELFPAMVKVEHAEDLRQDEEEAGDPRPANLSLERILREIGPGGTSLVNQDGQPSRVHKIGDYWILREIGRGGMGVVYEAEQISLGRRVALKALPRNVSGDRMTQERFRREARAAARLHHTNIVPVFEVGQDGDVRFYAMQFIQGQGLDLIITELRRLRDRGRSESKVRASSERPFLVTDLAQSRQEIEELTHAEGVHVSAVLQSILSGRFDPGDGSRERVTTSESMRVGEFTEGLTIPTRTGTKVGVSEPDAALTRTATGSAIPGDTTGAELEHPPASALLPSTSASSASAILPGGTQLSSAESGGRAFFRSLAQIGRQVAGGLAYAHARGIVHRDIKPSNLLLDTEGVVWIADFGLAKGEDEGLTQSGDILGTLRYMAPERFRGEGDARADIYALGMTLYELLTLRLGFDSPDRLKLIEQIKTEDPEKPRSIDARIPRDLETIVLKAIDKDPKARYQTAEAMGDDLRRFLADEPIRARQVSAVERYWRWARRNPVIAVLGGVLTAVLLAVTIGSMVAAAYFQKSARREANLAGREQLANQQSQRDRQDAIEALKVADHQRELARQEREVAQQNLYYAQMQLAQQGWREHRGLQHMRELLANWLPQGESPDRRGWEWFYLNALPYQNLRTFTEAGSRGKPCTVAWHEASKRLAAGTTDGLIRIWDVDREQTTLTLSGPGPSGDWWGIRWFAWSPDGRKLAAGFVDATVHVWETRSGRELSTFRGHKSPVRSVAYSSDGTRLASWEKNGTIKIWDASTGRLTAEVAHAGSVCAGAWSPDDTLLASGHEDGTVTISDTHPGDKIVTLRGHVHQIHDLAWSPDAARIASTSQDFTVRIWEVASEKMVLGPLRHGHEITSVAWEPGGHRLATGSVDQSVKIWDATTGREQLTLRGHLESVTSLAWSHDGRLASGCDDGSVRIWSSIRDQESSVLPGHVVRATSVSWSPDGKRLASGGDDGKIRIWDPATREEVLTIKGHEGRVWPQVGLIRSLAWSLDGHWLASAALDGTAKVWETASGRQVFALPADHGAVWSVAWSPNGAHLAAGSEDGTIRVLEGLKRTPKVRFFQAHKGRARALAWSPQGDRLASGGADKLVKLWDPVRGVECARMQGHRYTVSSVAWSPDGKRLASASAGSVVIAWDAATGRKLSTMRGHNDFVDAVVWSPDPGAPARLASASIDNTVRVWDPGTGEETLVLRGNSGMFHDISWHPDGAQLAAASSDGHVWLWDATLGFERDTTPRALPFVGRRIATGTARGEDLRWWADLLVRTEEREVAGAVRGQSIGNDPRTIKLLEQVFDTAVEKLGADHSENLVTVADLARAYETAGKYDRALPLYEKILDLRTRTLGLAHPDTLDTMRSLAESYIRVGRVEQALPLLGKWVEANPADTILSLRVATLQAWFGKEADFATTCRRLLKQAEGTNSPTTADRAAKIYCLRPSTDAALMAKALMLARRAVDLGKDDDRLPWFLMVLGMAEYRDGQYVAADRTLATAEHSSSNPVIEGPSQIFRVMSLFRQGRQDESRKRFSEIEARIPPVPANHRKPLVNGKEASTDLLVLWLAFEEAKLLLEPASDTTPLAPTYQSRSQRQQGP